MSMSVAVATDLDTPRENSWKRTAALIATLLMTLIFAVSGGWKMLDPFRTGEVLEQAKVPGGLGTLGASVLGTLEVFTAVLLAIPRYRRWGGLLASGLMLFFLGWIGFYYKDLVGQECSCFPIIKRSVGPMFFVTDGIMLALAVIAYFWSPVVKSLKVPAIALASVAAVALGAYGVGAAQRTGLAAPSPIVVDGKPTSVTNGKVFLFFYDPMCMHCNKAAQFMSGFNWGDTKVIAIPTTSPQFAEGFLRDNKLKAGTALELDKLRATFKFVDPPYGVALVDGHQKEAFGITQFEPPAPEADLKKLGFIH
jgi:uncharacterized membrane protein YphA (DoxX/SURF4 family)